MKIFMATLVTETFLPIPTGMAAGLPQDWGAKVSWVFRVFSLTDLGLTLVEAKRLLADVQREIVAAQAREHAVRRPDCSHCGGVCRVKDYRDHRWLATALPIDAGAGPAAGASLRHPDLPDGRRGVGADVPGRRGKAPRDHALP